MSDDKQLTTQNQINFDQETLNLIKKTVAVGANDTEFAMFVYQAKRTGLDPLARQIYCVKIGDKVTIQASIDGLRLVAQRSGDYAGQDEPEFVGSRDSHPDIAKVKVYKFAKDGQRYLAATGVAYWDEYKPAAGRDFMWLKMPHTMLAKVAEALALRKAFPQDLSGIYSAEEMDQAQTTPLSGEVVEQTETANSEIDPMMATEKQVKAIFAIGNDQGYESETYKEMVKEAYGLESFNDLTKSQASDWISGKQRVS